MFYKYIKRNASNNLNSKFSHIKSCLFVPGNQEKMLKKSYLINTNIIVPDLEDSVPIHEKSNARRTVLTQLENIHNYNSSNFNSKRFLFPRLNSISSNVFEEDLTFLLNEKTVNFINGFVIPKVNTPEEYTFISEIIRKREKELKIIENSLKLIVWIESALGMVNIKDIFKQNLKDNRIIASAFGAEDFCHDLGITRSEDLKEIETHRANFALTSLAYNILPFDTPNVNFKNQESIIKEIEYVKKLGFKGKFAIHPSQVDIINKHFSPSEEEKNEALLIKTEYEKAMENGRGSIEIKGKMVDVPVYKRALKTLERCL